MFPFIFFFVVVIALLVVILLTQRDAVRERHVSYEVAPPTFVHRTHSRSTVFIDPRNIETDVVGDLYLDIPASSNFWVDLSAPSPVDIFMADSLTDDFDNQSYDDAMNGGYDTNGDNDDDFDQ